MKTTFNIRQMPSTRFGFNVSKELGDDIRKIGAEKVLLIIDSEMQEAGLTRNIEDLLKKEFSDVSTHIIHEKILSFKSIQKVLQSIDLEKFDVIVGYGGWRCTDMCKVLSIASQHDFSATSNQDAILNIEHHGIPIVSVPTTPPNGAEIDDSVLLRDEDSKKLQVFTHPLIAPRLTVIDPGLMVTLPTDLTASTGLDALSHAIEALISIEASPFSEMYALQGFALLKENLVTAFRQPTSVKARYNVALGSLYSALALNMTGSGAVHAMSFPLTARYDISHPQSSALMLPHLMEYNLPVVPMQFVRMARYFGKPVNGGESEGNLAIEAVRELYRQLDHPANLSAYNVPRIEIEQLVTDTMEHQQILSRNPRILDSEQVRYIFENAM